MAHEGVDEVSWTSLLLLTLITLTGLFSFLILNLNPAIVYVDLLFYEVDISLGLLLLLFFWLSRPAMVPMLPDSPAPHTPTTPARDHKERVQQAHFTVGPRRARAHYPPHPWRH